MQDRGLVPGGRGGRADVPRQPHRLPRHRSLPRSPADPAAHTRARARAALPEPLRLHRLGHGLRGGRRGDLHHHGRPVAGLPGMGRAQPRTERPVRARSTASSGRTAWSGSRKRRPRHRGGRRGAPVYDLIFLDAPTFSNSKSMEGTLDIQRDHLWLIRSAAALLSPGGHPAVLHQLPPLQARPGAGRGVRRSPTSPSRPSRRTSPAIRASTAASASRRRAPPPAWRRRSHEPLTGTAPLERRNWPKVIQTIADYLALDGQSTYRILAYEKAAALFRDHPVSVAEMALRGELRELPGVGEAIEAKVLEYMATGDIAFLAELRGALPRRAADRDAPPRAWDPRRPRLVWEQAGVADLRDLEKAAREDRLRGLPGMGEKTEANILRSIETWTAAAAGQERGRRLRAVVEPQAARFVAALRALPRGGRPPTSPAACAAAGPPCATSTWWSLPLDPAPSWTPSPPCPNWRGSRPRATRNWRPPPTPAWASTCGWCPPSPTATCCSTSPAAPTTTWRCAATPSAGATRSASTAWSISNPGASSAAPPRPRSTNWWACATYPRNCARTRGRSRRPKQDRSRTCRSPRSARRPARPLRLDRRPGHLGADGARRPGEGSRLPLLLRPLPVAGHDRGSGPGTAAGPARGDPGARRTHRRDSAALRHRGGHPGRRTAGPTRRVLARLDFVTASIHSGFSQPRGADHGADHRRHAQPVRALGRPSQRPPDRPARSLRDRHRQSLPAWRPRPGPSWRSTAPPTGSIWPPPLRGGRRRWARGWSSAATLTLPAISTI